MQLAELKEPVGLLQSGGLSSLAVGVWLSEQSVPAHHYIADIGQAGRAEIDELASSLRSYGANVTIVDLTSRMAQIAAQLLRYRARHDGGYWNTTGASRFVLASELAPLLAADGCGTLAHGCVGGGNDERRFFRYTALAEPGLTVYSPWLDPDALERFPDRAAMLKAVSEHGLWLDHGSGSDRSADANLAGVSHESAQFEDLDTPVTRLDPRWSRWPGQVPAEPERVTVTFEAGDIVDVNGSGPDPLAWMTLCNEIGGRHGLWLRDVVERRIIGTVCRGIYEAPGLELLDRAWTRVLQASLDPAARQLYDQLSVVAGSAMYEARWLDPAAVAARTAIDTLLAGVSGQVTIAAQQGLATVAGMSISSHVVQQTRFGSGGNRWSSTVAA